MILLMKFMRTPHFALFQLCFKKLYSASFSADQNTLYCDRNKIKRRNVKTDVTSAYSQCREMFVLAVKSRVVAAAMQVLGMKEVTDHPKQNSFPPSLENRSMTTQKLYLRSVLDSSRVNSFLDTLLSVRCQDYHGGRSCPCSTPYFKLFPAVKPYDECIWLTVWF